MKKILAITVAIGMSVSAGSAMATLAKTEMTERKVTEEKTFDIRKDEKKLTQVSDKFTFPQTKREATKEKKKFEIVKEETKKQRPGKKNNRPKMVGDNGRPHGGPGHNGGPAPVPEPSTILLMGAGILGLLGYRRKRFNKN